MKRSLTLPIFFVVISSVAACSWNPLRPFEREAPASKEAIRALDAGDAAFASERLEEYLTTGPCKEGAIAISESVHRRWGGTFDLGLALFALGESYGQKFGDEEMDSGLPPALGKEREAMVDCAVHLLEIIASETSVPLDMRANAHFLLGNLHFLTAKYENAVSDYDRSLEIVPGRDEAGSSDVGVKAAWNRAIALRRIEEKKDAGNDGGGGDGGNGKGDGGNGDAGADGGGGDDGGSDGGGNPPPSPDAGPPNSPDAGDDASPPPPPTPDALDAGPPPKDPSQDDRILDLLERAPTLQQETAKRAAGTHRVRGGVDK